MERVEGEKMGNIVGVKKGGGLSALLGSTIIYLISY